MMEEEKSSFVEQNYLNLDQVQPSFLPIDTPAMRPISEPVHFPRHQIKACNPFEMYKDYPPAMRDCLIQSFFHKKLFAGIQMLFGINCQDDQSQEFLEAIDADIFNPSGPDHNLVSLFGDDQNEVNINSKGNNHRGEEMSEKLEQLTEKLSNIQKINFKSISMNKTIGKTFAQRFDNFLSLKQESSFTNIFLSRFENFLFQAKKKTFPGLGLITLTFQFWMEMFKQFMHEIWKHNEKYSLNLFKKQKNNIGQASQIACCGRSTISSSNTGNQKQKRRSWGKSDIELLEKMIESKAVFSQARLEGLSQQLGRTPSSIASKVAKINKIKQNQMKEKDILFVPSQLSQIDRILPSSSVSKKITNNHFQKGQTIEQKFKAQNESSVHLSTPSQFPIVKTSLKQKILDILLNNREASEGLTKEQIIQKMCEKYQLGIEDESWKNSVGSILSQSKQIQKMKPIFRLINPHLYEYNYTFSSTFKDRVARCLLSLPNYRGDTNQILKQYENIFRQNIENNGSSINEKILTELKNNISKTLLRYSDDGGIFCKDQPKTLYKYNGGQFSISAVEESSQILQNKQNAADKD